MIGAGDIYQKNICDGAFFKGSEVARGVRAGTQALQDASFLSRITLQPCAYVIHREETKSGAERNGPDGREGKMSLSKADSIVSEILGTDGGINQDTEQEDRRVRNQKAGGIFIAVGQVPTTRPRDWVVDDWRLYSCCVKISRTSGVWHFAGDCRTVSAPLSHCPVQTEAVAALAACKYIEEMDE